MALESLQNGAALGGAAVRPASRPAGVQRDQMYACFISLSFALISLMALPHSFPNINY